MWETSSPAFDKDHDLHSFYVLVLKDGYYPAKTDITATSGAGAPAFIRIASLEQIYDSRSSINGYVSALDGTMLSGIKVYVYNDGEKAGKAKEIAAGLASLDPMGYMDDFTGEEYHSAAVTEANGRYSADVMWDGETSPSFAVLAVGNGYEPELCSIEAGVCTASSPGVQDIKLARIEKTEEVV